MYNLAMQHKFNNNIVNYLLFASFIGPTRFFIR